MNQSRKTSECFSNIFSKVKTSLDIIADRDPLLSLTWNTIDLLWFVLLLNAPANSHHFFMSGNAIHYCLPNTVTKQNPIALFNNPTYYITKAFMYTVK